MDFCGKFGLYVIELMWILKIYICENREENIYEFEIWIRFSTVNFGFKLRLAKQCLRKKDLTMQSLHKGPGMCRTLAIGAVILVVSRVCLFSYFVRSLNLYCYCP